MLAKSSTSSPVLYAKKGGEPFLLAVGAFYLTVELLVLQSVEVLLRHTFPTVGKKARIVSLKT